MSALPLAAPRPARSPAPRRHLEVAPTRAQRRARPRVLPAIVTISGIGAILLAQLLLSIVLADGAYTIAELQAEQRDLQRQEQALTEQLEVLSSTQNLIANAEHLGMVASGNPVFLDLSSGSVSGNPTPAGGSLTGSSGNQVGNSLLTGATLVEPAPADEPTAGSAQGQSTQSSSGSGGSGGSTSSSPGTIPSPTTH
jgi:cell division protein FtsB